MMFTRLGQTANPLTGAQRIPSPNDGNTVRVVRVARASIPPLVNQAMDSIQGQARGPAAIYLRIWGRWHWRGNCFRRQTTKYLAASRVVAVSPQEEMATRTKSSFP